MTLTLAENIRVQRRQRGLTQEQLAEALGVTTGAVHKWEAGASTPELSMIVELADFFDLSVDALLGYRLRDNSVGAALARLSEYCRTRDPQALTEAEKALKRYPQSFEVVHECASVYFIFGAGEKDRARLRRSLELLEQARRLLSQNTDAEISELTLFGEMANVYLELGETEKGLALLKQHNAGGIFSGNIGAYLASKLRRPKEAEPYLMETLIRSCAGLIDAVLGSVFVFCARGDYDSAREIILWGQTVLQGLRKEAAPDYLDKMQAVFYVCLAHVRLKNGQCEEARAAVEQAGALVRRFDTAPDYSLGSFRFAAIPSHIYISDSLGATAGESVDYILTLLENEALRLLWKEAQSREQ